MAANNIHENTHESVPDSTLRMLVSKMVDEVSWAGLAQGHLEPFLYYRLKLVIKMVDGIPLLVR